MILPETPSSTMSYSEAKKFVKEAQEKAEKEAEEAEETEVDTDAAAEDDAAESED